jgi:hypothetical protein
MKNHPFAFFALRLSLILITMVFFAPKMSAQNYDTLHLYYNNISVQPHDTTLKKLDKWIKGLNGKHQDIKIIAYYHKLEFKKYSQQRIDEMFLTINRKARPLFTITEMKPAKGKDFQRTTVDIIYTPTGGSSEPAAKKEAPADNKKEKEAGGKIEKGVGVTGDGKSEKSEPAKEKKSEAKAEKPEKKDEGKKVKPLDTDHYIYDSVYINGKLKVTKKKKK